MNELLASIWDETALLAEIDRMESLITPVAGDLSGPIQQTRDWIVGRASKIASDFSSGPPAPSGALSDKMCLEIRGHLDADFSALYSDPIPGGLPPGSSLTPTSFAYEGGTTLTGISTAFGVDPSAGPHKLVLRPIGLTGYPDGLIFNIVIDDEDVVANLAQPVPVSDSIASFLLYLNAAGSFYYPVGMVVNTQIDLVQADLYAGGSVSGSVSSDLATWVPHPVPEPGQLSMMAWGLVGLGVLARSRSRKPGDRLG